jgi:hypothetical protein
LKTYFSGGGSNSNPLLSIGGAISSAEWSGGTVNDLFPLVTGDQAVAGVTQYRVIYLKNTDANANGWQNVMAWLTAVPADSPAELFTIALATAKNAAITAGADQFTVPTGIGSFSGPTTKAGGLALATPLSQNDYQGIALKRVVPANTVAIASIEADLKWEGDTVP